MEEKQTKILFTKEQITRRVNEIADEIVRDYKGKDFVFVGILTGSFIFLADLARTLWEKGFESYTVDFIGVSSYGHATESSRNPQITKDLSFDIEGKDILLIEDVVETGYSLLTVCNMLKQRRPTSLKTIVLLDKKDKREVDFTPEYSGFVVPGNAWVEGYGLDTDQFGRGNPEVIVRE